MPTTITPAPANPSFTFDLVTNIKAPYEKCFDYYTNPRNMINLHLFAYKVDITSQSDTEIQFTATDKVPILCTSVSVPTYAYFQFPPESPEKSKLVNGGATSFPSIRVWTTFSFTEDPADSGSCIVKEHFSCTCPALFKGFTKSKAHDAHVHIWARLKEIMEAPAQ
jgi:hypothetical protein